MWITRALEICWEPPRRDLESAWLYEREHSGPTREEEVEPRKGWERAMLGYGIHKISDPMCLEMIDNEDSTVNDSKVKG